MPDQNIDSLFIDISADSGKATRALNNLTKKLATLDAQLKGMNTSTLVGLANGLNRFARAASTLSTIKTADFTRIVKNINKLSQLNTAGLNRTASCLNILASSLSRIGNMSRSFTAISELVKNIGKLGGVNVQRAITNIPLLAKALRDMMVTLSRAPMVSRNIIDMTNALANLAAQGSRSLSSLTAQGTRASNMARMLGTLTNRFVGNLFGNRRKILSFAGTIGTLYANFWMLFRAMKWVGKGVKSMMDYIEDYNYFNVTFDKIGTEWADAFEQYGYDNAEAYAKSFEARLNELNSKMSGVILESNGLLTQTGVASLGLDISELTAYEANIGAITNALGLNGETSLNTSKALTMLAGDMSSLKNIDLDTVMTNFSSGLIGQSRALYKYGIDITNANLQQYAYKYGLEKTVLAMTQAEKMQLRLLAILDQSRVSWGDLADTINSPSNQLRMLENNFRQFGRMLGGLLTPLVSGLLPYLNALALAMQKLVEWTSVFFGIKIDYTLFGDGYSEEGGAYGELLDELDDVAEGYDDATKAAKKYENTVLSIDQLHKLNGEKDSSGSGASGGIGGAIDLTNEIADAVANYEKVWNAAFESMENKAYKLVGGISDAISEGDFKAVGEALSTGITNALDGIKWDTKIYFQATKLGQNLASFLNGFITPEMFYSVGTTAANSLNTAIKWAFGFVETLDWAQIGESVGNGIMGLFQNFNFDQFADTLNEFVDGLEKALISFFKTVKWGEVAKEIVNFLCDLEWDTILFGLAVVIGPALIGTTLAFLKNLPGALVSQLISSLFGGAGAAGASGGATGGAASGALALPSAAGATALTVGTAASIGGLIALPIAGTAYAWKYQNDEEFRKKQDNRIANSPLKHVESNLDYGSYFDMEKALEKQIKRKNKRKELVLEIQTKFADMKDMLSDSWDNVEDYFKNKIVEVKSKIDDLRAGLKKKWDEVQRYWKTKPVLTMVSANIDNIRNKLSTVWENARNYWASKPVLTTVITTINNIASALSSKWSDARTWWSEKTGLSQITATVISFKELIKSAWENAKTWAKNNFKLKLDVSWNYNADDWQKAVGKILWKRAAWPTIKMFESGGFPTMGELFIANEAGPELVGRMGTKTAVANQEQITSGIAIAVRTGMFEAMNMVAAQNGSGKKIEFVVNIDGKEIGRVAADYNKLNEKKYNVTPSFA